MADSRRQTRSTRRWEQQTDAQFWSNQPDPLMIERGKADAIQLVRSSVNPAPETLTASGLTEANATNVSGIPQMVFVDDEGLEEQFLTDGEDTANILDTSANRCNNTSKYNSDKPKYPTDPTRRAWFTALQRTQGRKHSSHDWPVFRRKLWWYTPHIKHTDKLQYVSGQFRGS